MAIFSDVCSQCGGTPDLSYGQGGDNLGLRWSATLRCRCGAAMEADGRGLPPAAVRRELFEPDGIHELVISDATLSTLRELQRLFRLQIREVAPLRARLPGAVVFGTVYEIRWLAAQLSARGVPAILVALDRAVVSAALDLAAIIDESWSPGMP